MKTAALLVIMITALLLQPASAIIRPDSLITMTKHTLSAGEIWFPKGTERVRGIYLSDELQEEVSQPSYVTRVLCHMWKFAYVSMVRSNLSAAQTSNVQLFFDDAANVSGRPEVKNVPIIWTCGRWLDDSLVKQVADKIISAVLFDGVASTSALSFNTSALYYIYECRHEDMIPNMPGAAQSYRQKGYPLGYYPVWGWTRGHFNGKSYAWAVFDWAARNIIPSTSVPADGKMALRKIDLTTGWLGDPASWYAEWPRVYRFQDYSGDKSLAPWIPDSYTAHVWRSTVAQDEKLTNKENPSWGVMRSGTHGDDTYGCSSPPRLGVVSPVSIYNKDPYNPIMVPRDTILSLTIRADYDNLAELRVYEGDRRFAVRAPSAYKVWTVPCTLRTAGVRAIICEATLKDGKQVTSWPATIFVDNTPTSTVVSPAQGSILNPALALQVQSVRITSAGNVLASILSSRDGTADFALSDLRGRSLVHDRRGVALRRGLNTLSFDIEPVSAAMCIMEIGLGGGKARERVLVSR